MENGKLGKRKQRRRNKSLMQTAVLLYLRTAAGAFCPLPCAQDAEKFRDVSPTGAPELLLS